MTSTGEPYPQLTLFAADTLANPSVTPAQETELTTRDICGHVSPSAFAWFDHDLRCWKTLQGTFLSDLEMCKPIWPRSGITQNGIAYQRQPSVPRTFAIEYSLSLHGNRLWATPTTQEIEHPNMTITETGRRASKSGNGRGHSIGLADQVKLWPKENIGGSLNPEWVEWLMGFPIGWTDLED
jgi:hypothetical protein